MAMIMHVHVCNNELLHVSPVKQAVNPMYMYMYIAAFQTLAWTNQMPVLGHMLFVHHPSLSMKLPV